jgi:hypothetical protein
LIDGYLGIIPFDLPYWAVTGVKITPDPLDVMIGTKNANPDVYGAAIAERYGLFNTEEQGVSSAVIDSTLRKWTDDLPLSERSSPPQWTIWGPTNVTGTLVSKHNASAGFGSAFVFESSFPRPKRIGSQMRETTVIRAFSRA